MWTDEKVELLRRFWAKGLSASQVGALIGETRNAVIGKVWRLKLPKRLSRSPCANRHVHRDRKPCGPRAPRQKKQEPKVLKFGAVHKTLKTEPVKFTASSWQALPGAATVSLLDLGQNDCRWPIGDPLEPGFGFCGCAVEEGRSYCQEHYARSIGKGTAAEQRAIADAEKVAA